MIWSDSDCDLLGQCIDKGMSGTGAGMVLHRSRSACIGKAHALGWRFGEPRPPHLRVIPTRGAPRRERSHKPARPPRKMLCVNIDDDTYEQIQRMTETRKTSRASVVRDLIEWGLMAEEAA